MISTWASSSFTLRSYAISWLVNCGSGLLLQPGMQPSAIVHLLRPRDLLSPSATPTGTVDELAGQTCSLCVRPIGGVTVTEKRGRGGPPQKHKPHRHGPEGPTHPSPGPSSHRQPCFAGLKSRSERKLFR